MAVKARTLPAVLACASSLACSTSPTDRDIQSALASEYGDVVRVENVRRLNGIAYAGGSGVPESYTIEFVATVVANGPVTFRLSANLERALEKCSLIKGIGRGHQPDATGLAVFFDIGTGLWRTDETRPAAIGGEIRFVKTENGWRKADLRACLDESSLAAGSMPTTTESTRQVHVAHILFKIDGKEEAAVRKRAQDILEVARKGGSFAALAETYSEDETTSTQAGDLGFIVPGQMVKPFDEVAFSLAPGQISDLVRTSYGYHIIKVIAER